MQCYHHPNCKATYIVNLGTAIDLDTPVCEKCARNIEQGKAQGINPSATIRPIREGEVVKE